MAKVLNTTVHVYDADGNPVVFGPGDKVPKEFRDQIAAPGVWDDDDDAGNGDAGDQGDATSSKSKAGSGDDSGKKAAKAAGSSDKSSDQPVVDPDRPPKVGSGSAAKDWLAYANDKLGLGLADDTSKADIITAVEAREAQGV